MNKRFVSCFVLAATMVFGGQMVKPARAAFVVPDGATAPFTDWSRSDADSMYAEWDVFSSATGPNAPDVGSFGPTTADVAEAGTNGAFITSGGNIYSFSAPTDFDVTIPNYGYGAGYNTRVVAQLLTLGSSIDESSFRLSYHDGGGGQTVAPNFVSVVSAGSDFGASQESLLVWDIAGYNPTSLLFEFNAAASSMSLDRLVVDTFTQTGEFGPQSTVPEPTSIALASLAAIGLGLGFVSKRSAAGR